MYVAVIFELKVDTCLQECSGGRCKGTFFLCTNLLVSVKSVSALVFPEH